MIDDKRMLLDWWRFWDPPYVAVPPQENAEGLPKVVVLSSTCCSVTQVHSQHSAEYVRGLVGGLYDEVLRVVKKRLFWARLLPVCAKWLFIVIGVLFLLGTVPSIVLGYYWGILMDFVLCIVFLGLAKLVGYWYCSMTTKAKYKAETDLVYAQGPLAEKDLMVCIGTYCGFIEFRSRAGYGTFQEG